MLTEKKLAQVKSSNGKNVYCPACAKKMDLASITLESGKIYVNAICECSNQLSFIYQREN